jgi:hypothetical protein
MPVMHLNISIDLIVSLKEYNIPHHSHSHDMYHVACLFSVLTCLQKFLPEMQSANLELDQQRVSSHTDCNMEILDDYSGPVIEMVSALYRHVLVELIVFSSILYMKD